MAGSFTQRFKGKVDFNYGSILRGASTSRWRITSIYPATIALTFSTST